MLTLPELKTNLDQGNFKSWSVFALLSQTGAVFKPHTHTMTHSPICVPLPKTLGLSLTLPYNNLSPRPLPSSLWAFPLFFFFPFFSCESYIAMDAIQSTLWPHQTTFPQLLWSPMKWAQCYIPGHAPTDYMHLFEMRKTTHSPSILSFFKLCF